MAEAVISAAFQIAEEEGLKNISEVNIGLGEFQQLELDIFRFALSQLKTSIFRNAVFNIEVTGAQLKCKACGFIWSFKETKLDEETMEAIHFVPEVAHAYIKCLKCRSPDFEIISGRGVQIESIKGVK